MLVLAFHLLVADALVRACNSDNKRDTHRVYKNIRLDKPADWCTTTTPDLSHGPQSFDEYVQLSVNKAVMVGVSLCFRATVHTDANLIA
jgi:hypothetical protein